MTTQLPLELVLVGTALLLAGMAWLALAAWRLRRRARQLVQAQREEAAARRRAANQAARLAMVLDALDEGILLADDALRVLHWNARFAALSGLPPALAPAGTTLADVLRLSAEAGEFGLVEVEAEVARQLALIARGPAAFPQIRHRPDGTTVAFRLQSLAGDIVLLRCAELAQPPAEPPAAAQPAPPTAPPAAAPSPAPPAPASPPAVPPARPARCLVLLVEDMKVNQMVTATQLRREGHRVDVASSGEEAIRLAARTPYDIVLMDLMMPGMSGYDAARRLRAMPGLVGQVPIFALTANTGEEERARCEAAGMQGMLSKPVPVASLREALQHRRAATPSAPPPAPAPMRPAPAEGLLDPRRLEEMRRDLPGPTLATLCRLCLDDMAIRLQALDQAVAAADAAAIEREAHALAGMAGSYGLAAIEQSARTLMTRARAQDIAAAPAALAELSDLLGRSRAALLAWLSAA